MFAPTERQSSKFGFSGFSGEPRRDPRVELEQSLELEVVAQDLGDGPAGLARLASSPARG
jgi:hypothetical protein